MDCPTEEARIPDTLARLAGITRLDFNLIGRKLSRIPWLLPSHFPADVLGGWLGAASVWAAPHSTSVGNAEDSRHFHRRGL